MNSASKTLTLTLIVLLLASLFTLSVTPVNVQAASKPAVPQFTLKLIDKPWVILPIQTTDPYTGTPISKPGYQIEHKVIEITIKNQNCPDVMYSVRVKGHFEEEWKITHGYNGAVAGFVFQSDGKNAVAELNTKQGLYETIYPDGAQVDIQVMALQGGYERRQVNGWVGEFFEGVTSDWSKTQTITVAYGPSSSSPSQTAVSPENPITAPFINQTSPESQLPSFVFQPSFLLWVGALLFTGVAIAVVVMYTKKHLKPPNYNN